MQDFRTSHTVRPHNLSCWLQHVIVIILCSELEHRSWVGHLVPWFCVPWCCYESQCMSLQLGPDQPELESNAAWSHFSIMAIVACMAIAVIASQWPGEQCARQARTCPWLPWDIAVICRHWPTQRQCYMHSLSELCSPFSSRLPHSGSITRALILGSQEVHIREQTPQTLSPVLPACCSLIIAYCNLPNALSWWDAMTLVIACVVKWIRIGCRLRCVHQSMQYSLYSSRF